MPYTQENDRILEKLATFLQHVRGHSVNSEQLTLSVEQAAKLLGVSRTTGFRLAASGGLPTIRLGRRILVPKVQIERLLRAGHDLASTIPDKAA